LTNDLVGGIHRALGEWNGGAIGSNCCRIDRLVATFVSVACTGPSPTLVGMFQRTLQMKYAEHDKLTTMHRAVYNIAKDRQQIYFDFTTEEEACCARSQLCVALHPYSLVQ
jgi:hypothetical protein